MKRISKWMSLVLRHKPELAGLQLDEHGWVATSGLIAGLNNHGLDVDMETLVQIVRDNDKQRFAFNEDYSRICANQGHSVDVMPELEQLEPPALLYHGTPDTSVAAVLATGLERRNRHHVHLSEERSTAVSVGGRRGKPIVLTIRSGDMQRDGYLFFRSRNGVWLTEHVPPGYIDQP